MKDTTMKNNQLIIDSYMSYRQSVYLYIYCKINSKEDAEDISQDVFLRLIDYKQILREDTVRFFIFTIARNLLTDYLRHYYKKQEVTSYIYDFAVTSVNDTDSRLITNDIAMHEQHCLTLLPPQRCIIYKMSRFENKSLDDISKELQLSRRTIENHLFIGRKEMRAYLKDCV
ncbi:sigma-70 family RNA polymerase sigma factor [Bacteroides difficilis]|uniref:sigma-70 family RNA polymerase sigma factor n=1 Tax=Bacteroides difficilis TaxID=2763021 RepID=UPI003AB05E0F